MEKKSTHHHPFVYVAIWIARVIAESPKVSLLGCVDELPFVQGHEVEVFNAFLVILYHALSKLTLPNDFADVFINKFIWTKASIGAQTIAFLCCLEDGNISKLL